MIGEKNRIIALFLCAFLILSNISMTALAATSEGKTEKSYILTSQEISKFNPYVSLDKNNNQFIIDKEAKIDLTKEEYAKLEINIKKTNQVLKSTDKNQVQFVIIDPKSQAGNVKVAFTEGETKVEFYWWGARFFISKTNLVYMGSGITIAGIWIPQVFVARVVSTLGVIITQAPGGIWFDYNFWIAGITSLFPGMPFVFAAVTDFGWQ